MTIYNKLAAVKKEIGAISKDETNPFFNLSTLTSTGF